MAAPNGSLGYVVVDGGTDGAGGEVRGASLVVDPRGIPTDFRYTDPIRPTRLERILYGNALDTYLREELILQSLLDAVETKPQLWVCNDLDLLAPLRDVGKVKAAFLAASAHAPLDSAGATEPTSEKDTLLFQADGAGAPLRVTFPAGTKADDTRAAINLLTEAARTMELLEPFNRIRKAFVSLESLEDEPGQKGS